MAELVDAADSKSVALKRRVGSIPSPGTISTDELLQQLWLPRRPQSSGGRLPAAPRVRRTAATIHYQNPKVVVGCVPEYQGRILICKRGIEPRLGYWTIPAGLHGKRRDPGGGRRARGARRSPHRGGNRQPAAARQRHQRAPGARVLPFAHADARLRHHAREPRGEAGRREEIPGTTSRSPAPNTRCAATSRTVPPAWSGTTWPKCSADSG